MNSVVWAVLLFAAAVALAVGLALAPGSFLVAAGRVSDARELSGVWRIERYSPKIDPGATALVYTPEGKEAHDRIVSGLRDGSITDTARTRCTPDGVPRIMAAPYPFEISQSADRVTLRFEVNNAERTIMLDESFPTGAAAEALTPAPLGHSYGRWERDTLIVESAGFTADTFLDTTGLPHSEQLYVMEYFWKSGRGEELQYVALVLDPETFSQVWAQRYIYTRRSDIGIETYACGGPNRDISQVPGAEAWP